MSLNYHFKMKLVFFFILTVGCLAAAGQEASTSKKKLKPYMEVRDDCYGENPKEKYAHPQDVLKNVETTNLKAQTQLRSHVEVIGKVAETLPETTTPKGTTPNDGKADKATAKTTRTPDNLATASTAKVDEKINSHSKTTTEQPTKPSYPFRTQPKVVNGLVAGEEDPQQLSYVDHSFYKSALVYNNTYFNEHWTNVTNGTNRVIVRPSLKNMATPHAYRDFSFEMRMPFDFPFYGHYLKNITICTGGYVFTGPSNHRWYAQQQNISPLMANFDLTLDETSGIVLFEEADKVTIVWENMKLRERRNLKFTFAVTIYKNGDIYFAYKEVPMKIQSIGDRASVFIGLADSYFMNKVAFYVNRRTLHNYSRIPFYGYNITSGSVLQLIAQPSCPMYNTCEACVAHEEKYDSFKCIWCESLHKCTSGADFFRPYVADCDFDNKCSNNTEDNDTLPRLSFFHRIFNYAM